MGLVRFLFLVVTAVLTGYGSWVMVWPGAYRSRGYPGLMRRRGIEPGGPWLPTRYDRFATGVLHVFLAVLFVIAFIVCVASLLAITWEQLGGA